MSSNRAKVRSMLPSYTNVLLNVNSILSSPFRLSNNYFGDGEATILAECLAKMSCLQSIMCVFFFGVKPLVSVSTKLLIMIGSKAIKLVMKVPLQLQTH